MKAFDQLQASAFAQLSPQLFESMTDKAKTVAKALPATLLAGFFALSVNTATAADNGYNDVPVQINNISVQSNDTPGQEAVRRIGGGIVGGGIGYGVAKLGKANDFWTAALSVLGAATGQKVANEVFRPTPTVNVNATVGGQPIGKTVTNYDPNKYEFKNGTTPLSAVEAASLQTWVDAAVEARQELADNRFVLNMGRYKRTFATESDRRRIDGEISSAEYKDRNLVEKFKEARGQLTENLWVASMDFNRDVNPFMLQSAALLSTPTGPSATPDDILKNEVGTKRPKP